MPHSPSSLPATERMPTLDILRGFALMGILIMNMPGFSYSGYTEADGSHHWAGALDRFAEQARDMLFSGKFNSMFSLLFGIGFTIQFARMQERDPQGATTMYLRRLAALLFFGVVHACIFWPGDVLHTYALLGIVLVLGLRHVSERTLVALIGAALLYPAVNGLLRLAVYTKELTAARVRSRAWRRNVRPSMPGISMSVRMTFGRAAVSAVMSKAMPFGRSKLTGRFGSLSIAVRSTVSSHASASAICA